jgi:hypothetical protein
LKPDTDRDQRLGAIDQGLEPASNDFVKGHDFSRAEKGDKLVGL